MTAEAVSEAVSEAMSEPVSETMPEAVSEPAETTGLGRRRRGDRGGRQRADSDGGGEEGRFEIDAAHESGFLSLGP